MDVTQILESIPQITNIVSSVVEYITGYQVSNSDLGTSLESVLSSFIKSKSTKELGPIFQTLEFDKQSHKYSITHDIKCITLNFDEAPTILFQTECTLDDNMGILRLEIKKIHNNMECEIETSFTPRQGVRKILTLEVDNQDMPKAIQWFKQLGEQVSHLKPKYFEIFKHTLLKEDQLLLNALLQATKTLLLNIISKNTNTKKEPMLIKLTELLKYKGGSITAAKKV